MVHLENLISRKYVLDGFKNLNTIRGVRPCTPPPYPQNLVITRGGVQDLERFSQILVIFGRFYLATDTQNRKIFARLRCDFRLYRVPESKIFARLRRDFRLYTVPKSKIFARAYGALDIHSVKWPFCAAGKKILGVLRSKQHDFPLELESNRPK